MYNLEIVARVAAMMTEMLIENQNITHWFWETHPLIVF